MKHLIKKEKNILHGTIGWSHNGKDGQYCEAGDTVKIKWQPTAGWGLQEAHYTDGGGNVVAIEGGEFVMPDSAVVIGATFKRFFLSDWADNPYNPTPQPALPPYLKFTAVENNSKVGFCWTDGGNMELLQMADPPVFEYSSDGGESWKPYNLVVTVDTSETDMIELNNIGDFVLFRGENERIGAYVEEEFENVWVQTVIEGKVEASGDITSLKNKEGGDVEIGVYEFFGFFKKCEGLTTAPNLPSKRIGAFGYQDIFDTCTGLKEGPYVAAEEFFDYPPYAEGKCFDRMFVSCSNIEVHHFATLNNSSNVFYDNSSCASLTIHADMPPTIGNDTITGLKADCAIYVPAASVDAYKAAQYWSARAAYIQAIP